MNHISICLIVRNEVDNIQQCLKSVVGLSDDIVVVDTGSVDATKMIAAKYTQNIFDFVWCDDFSQARNFAVAKAKRDWVLTLDADETVIDFECNSIRMQLLPHCGCLGTVCIVNHIENEGSRTIAEERVSRLFNRNFFCYQGAIHEQLVRHDGAEVVRFATQIVIEHNGYLPEQLDRKQKLVRNKALLRAALANNPQDAYLHYQLGKTYSLAKEYTAAAADFETALALAPRECSYFEDLVVSYGYVLLRGARYSEALQIFDYYPALHDSADYLFVAALIAMNNAQFDNAVQLLQLCLKRPSSRVNGVNSFLALYNIGVIYECLGDLRKARSHYARCGDYPPAQNQLHVLMRSEK